MSLETETVNGKGTLFQISIFGPNLDFSWSLSKGGTLVKQQIEIPSRFLGTIYFVAKQGYRQERIEGVGMKGPSVPIQMESWFNGQCTSRISYFSMIIICWPGKLPTLLLLAFCSPA